MPVIRRPAGLGSVRAMPLNERPAASRRSSVASECRIGHEQRPHHHQRLSSHWGRPCDHGRPLDVCLAHLGGARVLPSNTFPNICTVIRDGTLAFLFSQCILRLTLGDLPLKGPSATGWPSSHGSAAGRHIASTTFGECRRSTLTAVFEPAGVLSRHSERHQALVEAALMKGFRRDGNTSRNYGPKGRQRF